MDQSKVDMVCGLVAMGSSQRAACDATDISESAFRNWKDVYPEVLAQYTRAREDRAHLWAEQLMEIADTTQEGRKTTIKPDGSEEVVIGDMLEHRKLRIETRKWMMARILKDQYGDHIKQEHTGPNGNPLAITVTRVK